MQIMPSAGMNQEANRAYAEEAVSGPEYTTSIPATGGAVTAEPSLEVTQLDVEAQTTNSISLKWEVLPNATIYYVYCYNKEKRYKIVCNI